MNVAFRKFASGLRRSSARPWAFSLAVLSVILWLFLGPVLRFSEQWQLIINTVTTIMTFLMVFLLQNTQNRDNRAIQIKLDELLRAVKGARTSLVNVEEMSDDDLKRLHEEFHRLRERLAKSTDRGD